VKGESNEVEGCDMGELKWKGPQGKMVLIVFGSISLFFILPLTYTSIVGPGGEDDGLILIPFLIIVMAAASFLVYIEQRDVWHSIRIRIRMPVHLLLPIIYKALTDGRVPFTFPKPEPGGSKIRFRIKWDQVIDLNYGDLHLNLMARQGDTFVFLGPVNKGNEREVAKVKGLIGKALG
jgi:hypothetical protein